MIRTERLVLRSLEPRDRAPLVALLSDPEVMRDLVREPSVASAEASIDRHIGYRASHGLGFWVADRGGMVAGWCGLKPGAPGTPVAGEVEIGWMFGTAHWGLGLATEAAQASLAWGWANTDAPRIVAITAMRHAKSRRVMERLGMRHLTGADFAHPSYAADDPMGWTVIHAIDRPE